ncbi:MAG: efflux RND transporter periplasmic adaptor subunit [Sphingomonadales bacterium]|nr:efflux RND transporter periplasmic adaptor subunit [Sphingomonadales bacterium]
MTALLLSAMILPGARAAVAEPFVVAQSPMTDWKAVFGRVEAKDTIAARARLGGTLVALNVAEGDQVQAGQVLGTIVDEKIAFQLSAIDAQITALESQLSNARTELKRAEELRARGVATTQQFDALQTQVDVYLSQIEAQRATRKVTEQQATEGTVLAPISGRVLRVPVAKGAVVMAGESIATVAGGGFFLRVSVPERHAMAMAEGDAITIETADGTVEGHVAKVYPLIEGGRVTADVEVPDLDAKFVDARVLVRLPLAKRQAILIPADLIKTHAGLDFVALEAEGGTVERAVVPGERFTQDGVEMVEIVTGLAGGERVVGHGE